MIVCGDGGGGGDGGDGVGDGDGGGGDGGRDWSPLLGYEQGGVTCGHSPYPVKTQYKMWR